MIQPPFKIIAAGICPQTLSAGQRAPNVVGAVVIKGLTGIWNITVDDPTATAGNCALILSPGSGSNLAPGISFGQAQQQGQLFSFESYRIDTGVAIDIEVQFLVVIWPTAEVDTNLNAGE